MNRPTASSEPILLRDQDVENGKEYDGDFDDDDDDDDDNYDGDDDDNDEHLGGLVQLVDEVDCLHVF